MRVPSPMSGQYTLDLRVNSIRDTGMFVVFLTVDDLHLLGVLVFDCVGGHSSVT